ncbi:SDR family NAD(P)-dependent oxidoreductase [Streptomyces sp. NPDC017405]|uniref:SDR family NAD(P)-dependent oxidoreductase n=1 Tax=unclassified Streptomyces TaxID=2593676 RepID=UPI00378F608D
MAHHTGAARTGADDPGVLSRLAEAVPGVREAAVVFDRRVRTAPTAPAAGPRTAPPAGTPVPGDRPAVSAGPPAAVPPDAPRTLTEALLRAADLAPGRGTTYLLPDGGTDRQTYPQLLDEARRALTGLRAAGLGPGDPVLLQCADSRTFLTGFWACVLGGMVPTPVGPVLDHTTDNAGTRRLRAAWDLLDRPLILTDEALRAPTAALTARWSAGAPARVASLAALTAAEAAAPHPAGPDDPAVHLLTSGSTGTPKCVRHAHRSIAARTHAVAAANGFTEHEVTLNFMPLDHVGGIVMSNVRDVFLRCEHVNARTEAFVRRPLALLDWLSEYRVTNTWAPNFAYALVCKEATAIRTGGWDLSAARHLCNAGEAVVARTARRFLDLLVPHGLPPTAMVACWGMSETSSGVTYSALDARDPSVGTAVLDPRSLDGPLATLPPDAPGAVLLTEVGPPVAGVTLRIVDEHGEVLPEGRIGRLQVTGDTLLLEYHRNPGANAAAFTGDGWFDTGDLAFLRDGRLTLTGRQKDMVIVNGANYPVADAEAVVEQTPGVRPACAAVCGVRDEERGTDTIVVFFVPDDEAAGDLDGTVAAVRGALARELALNPEAVIPLTAEEFPRTASGKVQRGLLLEEHRAGRFADRRYDHRAGEPDTAGAPVLERVWLPVPDPAPVPADRPVLLLAPPGSPLPAALTARLGRSLRVVTGLPAASSAGPRDTGGVPDRSVEPVAGPVPGPSVEPAADRVPGPSVESAAGPGDAGALPGRTTDSAAGPGHAGAVAGPAVESVVEPVPGPSGEPGAPSVDAVVDPFDPGALVRVLEGLAPALGPDPLVVCAWDSGPEHDGPADEPAVRLLATLSALARTLPGADVTVLTRGALGVDGTDPVAPGRAALAGLVRTAAAEGLCAAVRLVDAPAGAGPAELARLALLPYPEDLAAARPGGTRAPRLRQVETDAGLAVPADALPPGGTCLLIGGLGGLGAVLAEYLLAALGARLLVTGRTPEEKLSAGHAGVLADLRALGDVRYRAADVADPAALAAALAEAERDWGAPLDLAVHAAGASPAPQWTDLAAHELRRETPGWLRHMLHAKLAGGAALEAVLRTRPRTGVVLFSSVNGHLGGAAYGAYAAANAALDAYGHRWSAEGRYVRCLAWSMWSGTGMNDGSPLVAAAERRGLRSLDPTEGLRLLLGALADPRPYLLLGVDPRNPHLASELAPDQFAGGSVVVALVVAEDADRDAVRGAVAGALAAHGALAQLVVVPRLPRTPAGEPDVVRLLAERAEERRPSRYAPPAGPAETTIAEVFGEHLKQERVGRDDSVFALGGDSIVLLQIADALGRRLGREVPVPMLYRHATVRELAAALTPAAADR